MATSVATTLEGFLATPAPLPALEALRQRCLTAVSTASTQTAQARMLIRRVYDTELKTIFARLVVLPADYFTLTMPSPRRMIEADALLADQVVYHTDILRELRKLGVPKEYADIFERYMTDTSYANRVAGYCALTLLTTIVQTRN